MTKSFVINKYGTKYEFECGIDKESIFIKNLNSGVEIIGEYIHLEEGLDLTGADNLHIQIPDKEFGCFDGAINDDGEYPSWYEGITIDELYEAVYAFLLRIIRFKHGDLSEEEIFHVDQAWIDNPHT